MLPEEIKIKENNVCALLGSLKRVAVAFSGGVDSALLAALAYKVLGSEAVAVTVSSPLLSEDERRDAKCMAEKIGIRHVIFEMNELEDQQFAANPPDKCYLCKKMRFSRMAEWAREENIPWLLDGSNVDDTKDYRPGMRALAEISAVRSPLLEAGFTKSEIRELSRAMGLFTWNKPARACLASRLPYGEIITADKLHQIEVAERALEKYLPAQSQFRVRAHGDVARIETDAEGRAHLMSLEIADAVYETLQQAGFRYVALDIKGYRTGSLNEALENTVKGR